MSIRLGGERAEERSGCDTIFARCSDQQTIPVERARHIEIRCVSQLKCMTIKCHGALTCWYCADVVTDEERGFTTVRRFIDKMQKPLPVKLTDTCAVEPVIAADQERNMLRVIEERSCHLSYGRLRTNPVGRFPFGAAHPVVCGGGAIERICGGQINSPRQVE